MQADPSRVSVSGTRIVNLLKSAWRVWLKFAEMLGNIMMIFWLTLIYFTLFMIVAVPFKFFSDPLGLKHVDRSRWVKRQPLSSVEESMRQQG